MLWFVRNTDKAGEHTGEPRTHATRTGVSVKGSQSGAQELSEGGSACMMKYDEIPEELESGGSVYVC